MKIVTGFLKLTWATVLGAAIAVALAVTAGGLHGLVTGFSWNPRPKPGFPDWEGAWQEAITILLLASFYPALFGAVVGLVFTAIRMAEGIAKKGK